MLANTFGINWLNVDLPFPCDIHEEVPRALPDPRRFQVLWIFSEPEPIRIPEAALPRYAPNFDLILTHDERHRIYPNAVITPFWQRWVNERPLVKRFEVSTHLSIGGGPQTLDGYNVRRQLYQSRASLRCPSRFYISTKLLDWEQYGLPPLVDDKRDCLFESMFNIAIENTIEDNYFTEKLVDNFSTFTVPIYRGCRNLGAHGIDEAGIIRFDTIEECIEICNSLTPEDYYSRATAMHHNAKVLARQPDFLVTGKTLILDAYTRKFGTAFSSANV